MFIYPYNSASSSAKVLAEKLGIKRIKRNGSKFKGAPNKKVINWGCSHLPPEVAKCDVLNDPASVERVSNKLEAFKLLQGKVSLPAFSEDQEFVKEALAEGVTIVARTVLNGHSGTGIVIMSKPEDFVEAPLYTMYEKKTQEYRIHLGQTLVDNFVTIAAQRKARDKGVPDDRVNWKVRNLAGGFIFARNDGHVVPEVVIKEAQAAISASGLHFGAVDVIYHEPTGNCFVLEVNTAPGLSGQTISDYASYFSEYDPFF